MATLKYILKASLEVDGLSTEIDEFILPPETKKVVIKKFEGDAAFTTNSAIVLIWDPGGIHRVIWSTKGVQSIELNEVIPKSERDGIRKLSLRLDNGLLGPIYMSGRVEVELID